MKETEGSRFKKVRTHLKITQQKMAEVLGFRDNSGVSQIENDRYGVSKSNMEILSGEYGIRSEYIYNGKEPMIDKSLIKAKRELNVAKGNNNDNRTVTFENSPNNMILVPIKAHGGFVSNYENSVYLDRLEKGAFPWIKGRCFAFEVDGDSMVDPKNPKDPSISYLPGWWVVCTELFDKSELAIGKDYVFGIHDGVAGSVNIKRLEKIENGKLYLKPLNPEYKVTAISLKEVKHYFAVERRII